MICSNCGKTLPTSRFDVYCTCRKLTAVDLPKADRPVVAPCQHRGSVVGTANCGCQGKSDVYWCNKLKGHCTLCSTGKSWFSVETEQGKIDRVGKLLPCLHCNERQPAKCVYRETPPENIQPTSRRAVCTVVVGETAEKNFSFAEASHRAYAAKHGADYIVLRGSTQDSPVFEKHRYQSVVELYPEGTLCIDASDTFLMPNAPSIWSEVPDGFIGMTADHELPNAEALVAWGADQVRAMARLNGVEPHPTAITTYHNSGVWFGRPEQSIYWKPPPIGFAGHWCDEENWCRNQMYSLGLKHHKLSERWNYTWSMDRGLTRIHNVKPWLIHLAGMDNPSVPEDWKLSSAETRTALLRIMDYFISAV